MSAKKTTTRGSRTRMGRPPVYGERVRWLVHVPLALAAKVDRWRKKREQSRAAVIQEALEKLIDR